MSYLQNILPMYGRSNMGGLMGSISVARKLDVESIPEPIDGVIYGDIVFRPGRSWVSWRVTITTGSATNDTRQNQDGSIKDNRLPFSIARYSPELHAMFNRAIDDEFIVLYKESNGEQKIFGLLEAPVRFTFAHNTGKQFADRNEFTCEFYYKGPENMFRYSGDVASAPAGIAPAIVLFNGIPIASLQPGETLHINSDYSFTDYFTTAP